MEHISSIPSSVSTHPSPLEQEGRNVPSLAHYLFGETKMMGKYLKISLFLCDSLEPPVGNVSSPEGWELLILPCLPLRKRKGGT